MTNLEQLATMNAQVVIPAATLRDYLQEDRAKTWMEGVEVGMRMRAAKQLTDLESPLSMEQAINALGISETSIRTLIKRKQLAIITYPGITKILIPQDEIRRFKNTHTNYE